MSAFVYRRACEGVLREHLALTDANCRVMPSAEPSQSAGTLWVSIHPSGWRNTAGDIDYLQEVYGVGVTVSMKVAGIPIERWGELVTTDQDGGLDFYCRKIIGILHGNYTQVLAAANKMITGGNSIIYRPGGFVQCADPVMRRSSWWGATGPEETYAGMSQTIIFGGIERVEVDPELPDAG
jgi:hypothetical protein